MSIALDTVTTPAQGTTSFSHTCTGSNLVLIVSVTSDNANVTAVTYNGVSMTLGTSATGGSSSVNTYLYYLLNPATGSHTVSVSGGSGGPGCISASYTGVKQTGFPDASNHQITASSPSSSTSLTVVANGCWIVGSFNVANGGADSNTINLSAGYTNRGQQDWTGNRHGVFFDSTTFISSGSNSISGSGTGNGTSIACICGLSMQPDSFVNASAGFFMM